MDMSNFRPEIHVAQQSRRDKLRIHNDSIAQQNHHLGVYVNNLEQHHPPHAGLNYESSNPRNFRPGNICYDPTEICPEVLDFQSNQESEKRSSFENFYREIPTTVSSHDPQYFSTWKSVGSHSTSHNWVPSNQSPIFVGARMSTLDNDKPNYLGYQEFNSPPLNIPSGGDSMHCSSSLYQNALQELVTSSNVRSFERESRALSLSLSSVPSPRVHPTQIADRIQDSVTWKPSFSTGGSNLVSGRQHVIGGQSSTHRNVGPLGPFTGYSTILRVSKYLGPAEQLLDEHCGGARLKNVDFHEVSDKVLEEVRVSVGDFEPDLNGGVGDSGGSSFAFNGSTDSCQPENLQKKAKLIYMQDEVCKRYKQYHQQIQMVVSSFETVAGLSAATPYVSLALKTVTKHFRCLKNAISDQLKSIRNALGEELSSPCGDARSIKGEAAGVSVLKFFNQSFQKQKAATASGLGILESQHIWRPQRGLPERAVSILRAWLFDHFLHPYPTDTDKHMLATQTGLTRNQVSNWFINARVRVWKPMVEEIHMLETKGATETATHHNEGFDQSKESGSSQSLNRLKMNHDHNLDKQVEYSSSEQDAVGSNGNVLWNQEKRCRMEYRIPSGGPSMMGLVMPSHRNGLDIGGPGSVSLTLGLRQSAENGQRTRFGGQIIRDFVG